MKWRTVTYYASTILLIIGAALGIKHRLGVDIIYMIGGVGYTLTYMFAPVTDLSVRERRLIRMNIFAGLLFMTSGVFRFLGRGQAEWVLFFALAMVFMIYGSVALMITESHKKK